MKMLLRRILFLMPDLMFMVLLSIFASIINRSVNRVLKKNEYWMLKSKDINFIFPDKNSVKPRPFNLANNYEYFYKVKRNDTIVHIGAAMGSDVGYFCNLIGPGGRVIAIEAHPENCKILNKNIKINKLKQVEVIEKGVWNQPQRIKMISYDKFSEHSMFNYRERKKKNIIEVYVDTLDNILTSRGINEINLLHMNIEGSEVEALEGASKTLEITKHCIISTHTPDQGNTMPQVKRILNSRGFNTKESVQIKTHLLGWK